MSKLVLIKNLKIVRNKDKASEQIIRFDVCDHLESCALYRDLDMQNCETEYDVIVNAKSGSFTMAFLNFDDAERLMNDLVTYLQNDMAFLEVDLLNYETK